MSLFTFDHIHLLSSNPQEAADWYCEMLGGTIEKNERLSIIRDAPSINVRLGSLPAYHQRQKVWLGFPPVHPMG